MVADRNEHADTEARTPDAERLGSSPDRWLAYELHDGLLQWIVGARMNVEAAIAESDQLSQPLQRLLKGTMHNLLTAVEEGRSLISFLEDESLAAPQSIADAISEYLEVNAFDLSGRPLETSVEQDGQRWPKLPPPTAWNVLRIVQQAIRNTIQHADATRLSVRLGRADKSTLSVEVADNGKGFDSMQGPPSDGRGHFGLASMQHRAQLVGGQLRIESVPRQGTKVVLTFPASNAPRLPTTTSAP